MGEKRRSVLIADPDVEVVRALKTALGDDYEVIIVKDGSKALEQSILRFPDLILFDRHCPLIGATQFLRIIRSNPRTEEIPIVVLSDVPIAQNAMPGYLQGVLVKPLNLDEVRSRISQVLRKADAVKQVGAEDGAVSGSLDQISMPDLLQIFSVNRRSGCLVLSTPGNPNAEVYVHDGRIEEALSAGTHGEKALYRLLGFNGGRFAFIPARRAPSVSLASSTDSLLMEGMRQSDELARLLPELPPPSAKLERLQPLDNLPEGLHPVTAEIVQLVEYYPRVGELVDRAKASDLEVYLALRSLLTAGFLRAVTDGSASKRDALLTQEETVELRSRLKRAGLAPTYMHAPKVAVLTSDTTMRKELVATMARLPGFVAADLEQLSRLGFGPIGALQIEPTFAVEFYVVSVEDRMLPLHFAMSAGTVAGLIVGTRAFREAPRAVSLIEVERRASLLVARLGDDAPASHSARRVDTRLENLGDDSVHGLMHKLLTHVAGKDDLRGAGL